MSIAFGFHPLALALALLLAGALTWWTYRRTTPPISSARRATLIGLRWLSLSLVLLLLAEPVIRTVLRSTQTPILAVLLDTSRSLSDAVHPGEDYATALTETLARVADAAGDAEIRTFTFGADVRDWAPESDTIAFDGGRTDITTALEDIRSRFVGQPLRGIVLVSDGRYNTGSNPLYTAESYPVPIHTVVVGDTATYRDLRIENIATNEIGYVDREMPVQITLHANGYGGRSARVHLTGSNIAARDTTVVLPPDEAEIRFSLSMTPSTEGFQRFEAAVDALDGERTTANNRTSFSARILRRKLSVLFLAA
ncbi:MAG TPA: vWA domain-containing protein, partial [Rhodothermales bacterium]